MPIYLPPISRRQFLKQSLAAAAAATLAGCAAPATAKGEQGWALLSDIHIAADPHRIERGVNMTLNLRQAVQEVVDWPDRPATALVSGDLAFNSGETADYAAVVRLLEPVRAAGMPVYLTLGNHDHREHFWGTDAPDKRTVPRVSERQIMVVRSPAANWFVLDSLVRTLYTPGQLGPMQRAWLASALDRHRGKPAIVVVHHNPRFGSDPHALEDTEQLLAVLRPRPHVKALVFGHTHRWNVSQDKSGLHLVNLPPTAYVFQAGRPSGWVYAALQPEGMRLELRCLDRTRDDHGQVAELTWRA